MFRVLFLFLFLTKIFYCQNTESHSGDALVGIMPYYSYQFPLGTMGQIYTPTSNIGLNVFYKSQNNFTFGLQGSFLFGASLKDNSILGDMTTSYGYVLGTDASIEVPDFEGRGFHFMVEAGKIFSLTNKNPNSGIHYKAGIGFFGYKTFINIDDNVLVQIKDPYASAYDMSMSGLSLNQFLGYTFFSHHRLINITIGVDFICSFTKSDRNWNISKNTSLSDYKYTSFLIGPKLGFTIPLYFRDQKKLEETFYY
jgi:hypothetical protein